MAFEVRPGTPYPTALWDGRHLSSPYDPQRQALTWVEGLTLPDGALVVLAGDPLGQAARALRARGTAVAVLLPGEPSRPFVPAGVPAWAPEDGPLEVFLQDLFDRWGPEAVQWQVWPGFERLAGETAAAWARVFRDTYRTSQGSWLTASVFGRRFWRNAVRNALGWDRPAWYVPGTRPLVIAASGPSLEDGLEVLRHHRDKVEVWALPSSIETLVRRGLPPDAVVATDGGYYAREHLQRLHGTTVPVFAALGSAADPVLRDRPCVFFTQGLDLETALLADLAPPPLALPSQGTVAATALRLALETGAREVYIAGLDLCFRDVRGHVAPHTVDRRDAPRHQRLAPAEGFWTARALEQAPLRHEGVRTSPAMLTYAGWFRNRPPYPASVVRVAPSPLRWTGMTELNWTETEGRWSQAHGHVGTWRPRSPWPAAPARRRAVSTALAALGARIAACAPGDPWLDGLARTALPEALAATFRRRREGDEPDLLRGGLRALVADLRDDLA